MGWARGNTHCFYRGHVCLTFIHARRGGWGDPKVLGSPAALASIMRFADPGRSNQLAMRVLDGLADLNTISEWADSQSLRIYIRNLRTKGEPFSISIVLPEGNIIEADGRESVAQHPFHYSP